MANEADPPPALRRALAHYPGLEAARTRRLAGGLLHETHAVETPDGAWVAQRVNPIFAPEIHANIDAVTRHLARAGVVTPRLVATRDGAPFVDLADAGRWRVMSRLPGRTHDTCAGPAEARGAARLVGAFHRALLDFAAPLHPMGIPYHDTRGYLRALRAAVAAHPDHPRHADVAVLADAILAASEAWPVHADLPLRVIHGDLKYSNVLLVDAPGDDDLAPARIAHALIDLDTLCRLPLYYDLGDAWRSWCNPLGEDAGDAVLDLGVLEATAAGYLEVMEPHIDADERASLAEGLERISLELAARFATDTLETSYFAWDAARFASASEHNWVRACGQWRLHGHAVAERAAIRRALGV